MMEGSEMQQCNKELRPEPAARPRKQGDIL
jgi:hypothetical protein